MTIEFVQSVLSQTLKRSQDPKIPKILLFWSPQLHALVAGVVLGLQAQEWLIDAPMINTI